MCLVVDLTQELKREVSDSSGRQERRIKMGRMTCAFQVCKSSGIVGAGSGWAHRRAR